jgi:hypothetical protein
MPLPLTAPPNARQNKQPLVYWPVVLVAVVFTLAFVVVLTLDVCATDPTAETGPSENPDEELVAIHRPAPHAPVLPVSSAENAASVEKTQAGAPVQAPLPSPPQKAPSPPEPRKVEIAEKPATSPMPEKVEIAEKPSVPPVVEKVEKVAESKKPGDGRETFGTSVEFVESPARAAELARKEKRLQFVLHISGNFEDSAFT